MLEKMLKGITDHLSYKVASNLQLYGYMRSSPWLSHADVVICIVQNKISVKLSFFVMTLLVCFVLFCFVFRLLLLLLLLLLFYRANL